MTTDLQDLLDQSFGAGPAHPPLEQRLAAGRRALVRRRTASALAAAVVVGVLGVGWAVAGGSGDDGATDPGPADGPTSSTSESASEPEQNLDGVDPLHLDEADGALVAAEGVTVLETIENPLDLTPPQYSTAATYRYRGRTYHWLGRVDSARSGGFSQDPVGKARGSLAEWVASQPGVPGQDPAADLVRLTTDGRLDPGPGATILEQRGAISVGESFAPAGAPTAAALVERDGTRWWVLARRLPGGPAEAFPVSYRVGGATMAEFLEHSRGQYASGEGLR